MTADAVDRQAAALVAGGSSSCPTDTVYGLAARPATGRARRPCSTLKGRRADTPIAVLCADADQAARPAAPTPELARPSPSGAGPVR